MIQGFDTEVVIKPTIEEIFDIELLPMIVYSKSKLLYNCLVNINST